MNIQFCIKTTYRIDKIMIDREEDLYKCSLVLINLNVEL